MVEGLGALDKLGDELDGALEDALDEAAEHALEVAKGHTSGELAASLRIKRSKGSREIVTDSPYASFVEEGRGPIEAKGKALHFVANGRDVFVKRVGPAKAHPFMAAAADDLEATVEEIVIKVIGDVL